MVKYNGKLKKGSIKKLQEYIAYKIKERGFEDETLHERTLLLVEEVGELVKEVRKISGMYVEKNKRNKYEIGGEVADVINLLFAVAIKLKVDVEKEFITKEEKNDKRVYKRSIRQPTDK